MYGSRKCIDASRGHSGTTVFDIVLCAGIRFAAGICLCHFMMVHEQAKYICQKPATMVWLAGPSPRVIPTPKDVLALYYTAMKV
jgi:hypothetical protein